MKFLLNGNIRVLLITIYLFSYTLSNKSFGSNISFEGKTYYADSILSNVYIYAPVYANMFQECYASIYTKERFDIEKKNLLFRWIPFMFRVHNNEHQYIREMTSNLHYTAPDIYDQKITSSIGTIPRRSSLLNSLLEFFHINIYSTTLLYQELISPLSPDGKKYYKYSLDSIGYVNGKLIYKIQFKPRYHNDELVRGYMIVNDKKWSIRQFHFEGFIHLLHFNNTLYYGEEDSQEELLPVLYNIKIKANYLGNQIESKYISKIKYSKLRIKMPYNETPIKDKYDKSKSYSFSINKDAYLTDRIKFDSIRPLPLDSVDKELYRQHDINIKEEKLKEKKSNARVMWGEIGDFLINRYYINFSNASSVRCSPLLNPFLISYSPNKGFAYKQSFRYNCFFRGDKLLRVSPSVGYNFTRKEFYWKVESYFIYYPQKIGSFHVELGNGNRIYGDDMFEALNMKYLDPITSKYITQYKFKDTYMEVFNSIEIVNGLELDLGWTSHHRSSYFAHKNKIVDIDSISVAHYAYNSFAPRIGIKFTPGLYYYMNGKRKVNLQSSFPTFSLDWERSIKGICNSSGSYERIEFDMQHSIQLGLTRSIFYRIGGGMYTNQHQLYFIDFVNFSRNNLPERWNDEGLGTFHLLDSKWYNSTRKYMQGHIIYEAPFLLFPRIMNIMKNILKERLYFDALMTSNLRPYTEIGYGIGTHFFNFEVFASFNKNKYKEIGCKFGFELFDK
jgi:hypothetical protein